MSTYITAKWSLRTIPHGWNRFLSHMYTLWELKCGLHIELYAGEMTSSTIMNFSYVVILMCLFIICLKGCFFY